MAGRLSGVFNPSLNKDKERICMQFKVNNGAVKMLELIDQSKSLVWKITFPVVIVVMAWNLPDTISAIMPLLR
jgi:hypothetical protein